MIQVFRRGRPDQCQPKTDPGGPCSHVTEVKVRNTIPEKVEHPGSYPSYCTSTVLSDNLITSLVSPTRVVVAKS